MFHKICFSDLPLPPLLHPPYNYSFNSMTPSPFSPRQFPSSSFQPMAESMPLKTISNLNSSSNSRGARRDALERKRKKLFASRTEQRQAPHQEAHQDLGDPRQVQEGEGEGEVVLSPRWDSEVLGWDSSEGDGVVPIVRWWPQGLCQC